MCSDRREVACLLRMQGQQQQDSHELLRCLMEGLRAEERRALQQLKKGQVTRGPPRQTFIILSLLCQAATIIRRPPGHVC